MPRKTQPDEVLFETDEEEPMQGFSYLSGSYFDAAEKLRMLAWDGPASKVVWHSHLTIPSLIMFATALEVFINERSSKELVDLTLNKTKVSKFIKIYLPTLKTKKCDWYQDILALIVLRNELVHYSPQMRRITTAPRDVANAMKRSKVKFINSGYMINLGNPAFADWACATVRRFGEEVSKKWYPSNNSLMTHAEFFKVLESLTARAELT